MITIDDPLMVKKSFLLIIQYNTVQSLQMMIKSKHEKKLSDSGVETTAF